MTVGAALQDTHLTGDLEIQDVRSIDRFRIFFRLPDSIMIFQIPVICVLTTRLRSGANHPAASARCR